MNPKSVQESWVHDGKPLPWAMARSSLALDHLTDDGRLFLITANPDGEGIFRPHRPNEALRRGEGGRNGGWTPKEDGTGEGGGTGAVGKGAVSRGRSG